MTTVPDDPSFGGQRARARYFLSPQRRRKTVNSKYSAYDLKHAAERHGQGYIGIGTDAFLAEAHDLGFKISGDGPTARLNIADPLILPPNGECFCTAGPEPPTQICKTCVRERSAKFLDSPALWHRLKRERAAADAAEFARRWHANEPLSDEENARWRTTA